MEMITIDSLLLGPTPPVFEPNAEEKAKGITKLLPVIGKHIGYIKIDTEGYDVPVFNGAIQTILEGEVPFVTIEFQPKRTNELGCSPYEFVDVMYEHGYHMVRGEHLFDKDELKLNFSEIIQGMAHTAYEAFFVLESTVPQLFRNGFISTGVPDWLK